MLSQAPAVYQNLQVVTQVCFLAAVGLGVVTDIRSRRVPNSLVLGLLLIGAVGAIGRWSAAGSVMDALLGSGTGLGLWLPFWLLGLLGAGDVKYFAAASTWLGVSLAWRAALLAAMLGGILSVAVLVYQRGFRQTMGEMALQARHANIILSAAIAGSSDAKARTFPYALPMAMAVATAVLRPGVLLNP